MLLLVLVMVMLLRLLSHCHWHCCCRLLLALLQLLVTVGLSSSLSPRLIYEAQEVLSLRRSLWVVLTQEILRASDQLEFSRFH